MIENGHIVYKHIREDYDKGSVVLSIDVDGKSKEFYVDHIIGADGFSGRGIGLVNQLYRSGDHRQMMYTTIDDIKHECMSVTLPQKIYVSRLYTFSKDNHVKFKQLRELFKIKNYYRWNVSQASDRPSIEMLKEMQWEHQRRPDSRCYIGPRGVFLQVECPANWPYQSHYNRQQQALMSQWLDTMLLYYLPKNQIDSLDGLLHHRTELTTSNFKPHLLNRKMTPLNAEQNKFFLSLGELVCMDENAFMGKSLDTFKVKMIEKLVNTKMTHADFEGYRDSVTLKQKLVLESLAKDATDKDHVNYQKNSLTHLKHILENFYRQLNQRELVRCGKTINDVLNDIKVLWDENEFYVNVMTRQCTFLKHWRLLKDKLQWICDALPKRKGWLSRESNPSIPMMQTILNAYHSCSQTLERNLNNRIEIENYRLDDHKTKVEWDRALKNIQISTSDYTNVI